MGRPALDADARLGHGRRALRAVLALTTVTMLAEAAAGWWTGSLALLADAGHMLTDAAALGLAVLAARLAGRQAPPHRSFGHYRAETLVALGNGMALVAIALLVAVEAVGRLGAPREVAAGPVIAVASLGLAVNGVSAWVLARVRAGGLNVRAALLHVLGDMVASVGVLVSGVVIATTGFTRADPLAALGVAALVAFSAVRLVLEAVDVLLESTPRHLDAGAIGAALGAIPGVRSVHDLHVWCVTEGFECLACHVVVEPGTDGDAVLEALAQAAEARFGIRHTTFQLEVVDRQDREVPI